MRKKLLSILALTILVTSTLVGCGGESPTPSTLTILSTNDGTVLVMKAGTDSWTKAQAGMSLEAGDTIKTGDNSGAEITFFDGSTIELEAGTQIEITSLDSSPDTGAKTITLMQTIGTTISRVTKLLDPASSYVVETPAGVAAVRGSMMIVRVVFDDPNYEDGTVLITSLEGHIWAIWQGVDLPIPEGRTCIIELDQLPKLIPLNRPPVATSDSVVTYADSQVTVAAPGVLNNDSDPDGDALAVTALSTSGTVGAVTAWNADGSFTYDPDGQFEYLPAGNSTSDSFTYTVSDGKGGTDTATVTIIINGVYNQPVEYPPVYYPPVNYPPVAVDDNATTPQDTPVTVNVLSNDSDPDGDTLTVNSVTQGTYGSVTNNGGNITYTPNLGFTAIDSFVYTISDGKGGSDTATVTVAVTNVDETPTDIALSNSSVAENQPINTAVGTLSTTDPDPGDIFTYTLVSGNGSMDNSSFNIDGSSLRTSASFNYEAKNSYSIRVRSTDQGGLWVEKQFTITITDVNETPVAGNDSATTPQDTQVTINVLTNDSDPDGDALTVNSVTPGTHGSATKDGGNVTYTPNPGFTGTDTFTYAISDGKGGTDVATVTVTITAVAALATLNVQIDQGPTANISIYDNTIGGWAIDNNTGRPVNGQNHVTSGPTHIISVAGGHSYCVWVGAANVTYYVKNRPSGWSIGAAPIGGQQACGSAAADITYPVHFSNQP